MKKLLVAAIGAAAAIGTFADPTPITALRFESATVGDTNTVGQLNTLHGGGTYWSDTGSADNTYVIEAASSVTHLTPLGTPTKALNVKTKFGNPLSVNVNDGGSAQTIEEAGVYFDSLVKFTVCDDCPTNQYDGAKIVMWLQEDEAAGETNLYVNAGYLSYDGGVQVSNAIYKCGNIIGADFADAWHRVTIKAIANITTSTSTAVPGFAIFIDGSEQNATRANSGDEKWDSSFTGQFTFAEAVEKLVEYDALFPSLDQTSGNKLKMSKASFDGTGSITDIAFYDASPEAFADDYVAKKASVTIGSVTTEYTSLEAALAAAAGQTATIQLMRGLTLNTPLVLSGAGNITFDFAGVVLTNEMDACAITNVGPAVVYTDSVGGGGIRCTSNGENAGAMYSADGGVSVTIEGGNFWGAIEYDPTFRRNVYISGGSFLSDQVTTLTPRLVSGKKFADEPTAETGLYEVVNKVSYTVKFISGEGSLTNEYTEVEGTGLAVPTPAAVGGKTFSAWDPAIAGATVTVVADATYTAQYTNNIYTITFVIGENSSSVQKEYGSEITSVPEIPVRAGYTGAWDDDPAGDTVTGDKTYTYTYGAETYTITFVNEIGAAPASTNYTIESGAITLPTATTENVGVQFDGWTNATITAAITEFTPTAQNVGSFTLYAAWSSTGSSGYDGGDGSTFTVDPGDVSKVETATGHSMTDTVEGKGMTYAQAYALGLVDEGTGDVADLETTIEIKDGKVVVGLSEEAKAAYTITLKVYEKSSLSAAWPVEPTRTITLGTAAAAEGFTPGSAASGFYKTEVSISNK